MLSVLENANKALYDFQEHNRRIGNLNYFYNTGLSNDDLFKFGYQILSRFGINYLSLTHITTFETKFYEWVYKYIVGKKMPTTIKMLRGVAIEKFLLTNIGLFDNPDDFANSGVEFFKSLIAQTAQEGNLADYTQEDLEDSVLFVQGALRLNYDFFKERVFTDQGLNVSYRLKDSINVFGIIDSIIERKDFRGIVEMKTTERIPKEPYELHIRQLAFYLLATGLPYGYIYYIGNGGKILKKGTVYFRAFVFEREKVLDYILEYIETMAYKIISFLSKFNSPKELIEITVPNYTDFLFDQNLRGEYGNIFGLRTEKPKYTSETSNFI